MAQICTVWMASNEIMKKEILISKLCFSKNVKGSSFGTPPNTYSLRSPNTISAGLEHLTLQTWNLSLTLFWGISLISFHPILWFSICLSNAVCAQGGPVAILGEEEACGERGEGTRKHQNASSVLLRCFPFSTPSNTLYSCPFLTVLLSTRKRD